MNKIDIMRHYALKKLKMFEILAWFRLVPLDSALKLYITWRNRAQKTLLHNILFTKFQLKIFSISHVLSTDIFLDFRIKPSLFYAD